MRLEIGNIPVDLYIRDNKTLPHRDLERFKSDLQGHFRAFTSEKSPLFSFEVEITKRDEDASRVLNSFGEDEGPIYVDIREGRYNIYRFGEKLASFSFDDRRGCITVPPLLTSLDSALRVILVIIMAKEKGLFLHAAGITDIIPKLKAQGSKLKAQGYKLQATSYKLKTQPPTPNSLPAPRAPASPGTAYRSRQAGELKEGCYSPDARGYVFCGKSDSGKTTLSRISASRYTVLTDEISLVKKVNGNWRLFGTPFWGEMRGGGVNLNCDLEGLYFIHKDNYNKKGSLKRNEALRNLMENIVFFDNETSLGGVLFGLAVDLVEDINCFSLKFRPDIDVWDTILG